MNENRILLISLSNIGDAVMSTPVLQSLHFHFPEAVIDVIGDHRSSEIFSCCPYTGEIIHKKKSKFLRGGLDLILKLRKKEYSLVVDLRTDGLAYLVRAKKRLSKWNGEPYGPHAVQQHMGIIRSIHGNDPIPDCCIWTGAENDQWAEKILGASNGKKLLGLGPGANWPGKIWPTRKYLNLVDALKNNYDSVVLLGDSRDRELTAHFEKKSAMPVINLCGKTGLLQATAILKRMTVFIGNDSGLGHLASAVNTATVTIFGQGQPQRYRPWGSKAKWLAGENHDIDNISVENVIECLAM